MNTQIKIPTAPISSRAYFVGSVMQTGLIVAAALFLLIAGCKKDDSTTAPNPIVIPVQTTVQAAVNLRSDAGLLFLRAH